MTLAREGQWIYFGVPVTLISGPAMPTPLELLLDPISQIVFALYGGLILWEHFFPARPLAVARGWRLRGLASFSVYFFLSSYLPLVWNEYLLPLRVFDMSHVNTSVAALVGILVYEAGVYLWHRSMHASSVLWRGLHQMHHSAERLDTYGAFWFSPFDMIGWTALSSLCLTLIVGLSPEAAALVLYVTTFLAVFQHANIRTPYWLGFVVQRPESHSIHHQRGVHAYNYSDLPLFDLLFGTLRNPKSHSPTQGFYDGASLRVPEMLAFRDVSRE